MCGRRVNRVEEMKEEGRTEEYHVMGKGTVISVKN